MFSTLKVKRSRRGNNPSRRGDSIAYLSKVSVATKFALLGVRAVFIGNDGAQPAQSMVRVPHGVHAVLVAAAPHCTRQVAACTDSNVAVARRHHLTLACQVEAEEELFFRAAEWIE